MVDRDVRCLLSLGAGFALSAIRFLMSTINLAVPIRSECCYRRLNDVGHWEDVCNGRGVNMAAKRFVQRCQGRKLFGEENLPSYAGSVAIRHMKHRIPLFLRFLRGVLLVVFSVQFLCGVPLAVFSVGCAAPITL